jgi:glycosyltransferase involved in cell wall biosynthesis
MKKVLYVTHQLANSYYGGAETQMLKTMEQINSSDSGFQVKLFNQWTHHLEDYDIVHFFNPRAFASECNSLANFAKERGIVVAVSPVFYHYSGIKSDHRRGNVDSIVEKFSEVYRPLFQIGGFKRFDPYNQIGRLLSLTDVVLPNTREELEKLRQFFNIDTAKTYVVPNAAESSFLKGDPELFVKEYGVKDFILFIGRIEPQKNVLELIRAFQKSGLRTKLVVVGKPAHQEYAKMCVQEAGPDVIFLAPIPHDSDMLHSAYKAAKVIALPSYYETPGLAALEGGLAGANVVITKNGGTKEYFEKFAQYVDPIHPEQITVALRAAYNAPRTEDLSKHIEKNFTYERTAQLTIDAYRKALE